MGGQYSDTPWAAVVSTAAYYEIIIKLDPQNCTPIFYDFAMQFHCQ